MHPGARADGAGRRKVKPWQGCLDFNAWAEDRIRELDPELVIVSTSGAPNVEVDGEVERSTDGVVAELGRASTGSSPTCSR